MRSEMRLARGVLVLGIVSTAVSSSTDQISNVVPRRDTEGGILNVHDGAMYEFEGEWILIGTSYEKCESFTNCSSTLAMLSILPSIYAHYPPYTI